MGQAQAECNTTIRPVICEASGQVWQLSPAAFVEFGRGIRAKRHVASPVCFHMQYDGKTIIDTGVT